MFRENGFAYHVLTPAYRDATLAVVARAFCSEPISAGVNDPAMAPTFLDWIEFVDYWMDHCSANKMSVVVIDEKEHRVAGAFIVRDLLMNPPGFEERYSDEKVPLTPLM